MTELWDYQASAVQHTLQKILEGYIRLYVTLPTGTGKSIILVAITALRVLTGRVLVLVHRQDIAIQLFNALKKENLNVGLVMQGYRELDKSVVVATPQSLSSDTLDALISANERSITTVLIDEAHHAVEGSAYTRTLQRIEAAYYPASVVAIGFTATPYRSDKQSMLSFLPTCAFSRDIPDMVRVGRLSPLIWKPLHVNIDLSEVVTNTQDEENDYNEKALASELVRVAITKEIARLVASSIQQRPTLVFAVSIEHAEKLADAFCQLGYSARAVSSKQSRAEREQLYADWRRGTVQIVCNCSLLTEGFDFPEISAVVIARPTLSPSLYMQMIGRGTRLAVGKKDCLVLDVMGNDPDPGRQVVLPHLVGDTEGEGSHGSSTSRVTSDPLLKAVYGTDKPSLALLDPIGQSRYRWHPYQLKNFEGYVARISQYEQAIIERDPDGSGLYRSRLYKKHPQQEAQNTWIEYHYLPLRQQVALVHEAMDAMSSKSLSGKEADWLYQQATEKQLQLLQSLDVEAAQQATDKAWTGQRVSDLITFLLMKRTLTNPPPVPQEERNGNVV